MIALANAQASAPPKAPDPVAYCRQKVERWLLARACYDVTDPATVRELRFHTVQLVGASQDLLDLLNAQRPPVAPVAHGGTADENHSED